MVVLLLGATVTAITVTLGALRPPATHAEGLYENAGGLMGILHDWMGFTALRVFMGLAAGATVIATAFVTRRFTHDLGMGILAAVLVSLDPALLVDGQLAVPDALLRFAAVAALALALGGHPVYHWLVPIPIAVGVLLEPWFLAWGAVLALLLLFRGHIFAAPKHLRNATLQGVLIPGLVAIPAFIAIRQTIVTESVVCAPDAGRALLGMDVPQFANGLVAVPNPVVAVGGLAVLLALLMGAVAQLAVSFRLARLPGRIQVRLPRRLGRTPSRALWLAALAVAMPAPQVALVIGAIAIAVGVQALMADSPVFGAVVGILTAAFAVVVVVRLGIIIIGDASQVDLDGILQWLPWVQPIGCEIV